MGKSITSDGCTYANKTKCDNCKFVFYQECPNYRKERARFLLKEILPFDHSKLKGRVAPEKKKAYCARNKDSIFLNAALLSLQTGYQIKRLTLNQVISITMESLEVEHKLVIVECSSKLNEASKQQGVLESFVDKMLMQGKTIFIQIVAPLTPHESWIKL